MKLTKDEKIEAGINLVNALNEYYTNEEERKEVNAYHKARAKTLQADIDRYRQEISTGQRYEEPQQELNLDAEDAEIVEEPKQLEPGNVAVG